MSDPTIINIVLLLFIAVLNGKDIKGYVEWLRFKIRTYFKQLEKNERNNRTNKGPRGILSKRAFGLQRHPRQLGM